MYGFGGRDEALFMSSEMGRVHLAVCARGSILAWRTEPGVSCGARAESAHARRAKLVSVVFADIVGSTAWRAQQDPEFARRSMAGHFAR